MIVDNFGIWTPFSIEVLYSIVHSSAASNGLPVDIAFCHLVKHLSVQLYQYCISGPFTPTWRMIGMRPMLVGIVTVCIHLMIAMIAMADAIDDLDSGGGDGTKCHTASLFCAMDSVEKLAMHA